jgi:hypothetical protein
MILVVALMYVADHYLIVNNIERIHFPQYAMLALLLGLSLRNEMLIFFVTTFAGFVDEFLQFAMDPMKTNYLDFNDIVLNILGAAAGVVLLMGLRRPLSNAGERDLNSEGRKGGAKEEGRELGNFSNLSWHPCRLDLSTGLPGESRYEAVFAGVFRLAMLVGAVVVLLAGILGRIVLLLEQKKDRSVIELVNGKLSFIMSFERHDEFWIKSYFGKVFHILSVGEGIAAIAVLAMVTWGMVRWLRVRHLDANE